MHLTTNELTTMIKTWNCWYLTVHDEDVESVFSDNIMKIMISPCNTALLDEDLIADLEEYSGNLIIKEGESCSAVFRFYGGEHQPEQVLKAIKPLIDKSAGSIITIENSMEFTETILPDENENVTTEDKRILETIEAYQKLKSKSKEDSVDSCSEKDPTHCPEENSKPSPEDDNNSNAQDPPENQMDLSQNQNNEEGNSDCENSLPSLPVNKLTIRGKIHSQYIDVESILHNDEPFPEIDLFLEASRLFDTIKRSIEELKTEEVREYPFECANEEECSLVKLFLGTASHRRHSQNENILTTDALPEELAGVVTYIRYRKKFNLFNNPFLKGLRIKKRSNSRSRAKLILKACSCLFIGGVLIIALIIWLIIITKK